MKRRTMLVLSGMVTAFVLVAIIGLFGLSASQAKTARAATISAATSSQTNDPPVFDQTGQQLSTDVPTLQAEVIAYQQQLQQSYAALQQAYNEIQVLSAGGSRGFRNREGSGELFGGGG